MRPTADNLAEEFLDNPDIMPTHPCWGSSTSELRRAGASLQGRTRIYLPAQMSAGELWRLIRRSRCFVVMGSYYVEGKTSGDEPAMLIGKLIGLAVEQQARQSRGRGRAWRVCKRMFVVQLDVGAL